MPLFHYSVLYLKMSRNDAVLTKIVVESFCFEIPILTSLYYSFSTNEGFFIRITQLLLNVICHCNDVTL